MEKEYVVTVKAGVDIDQFDAEMKASTGAGAIPNRTVDVVDQRAGNVRNTHYALTEEEVETLTSLQQEQNDLVYQLGQIEYQIGFFTRQKELVTQKLEAFEKKQQEQAQRSSALKGKRR